ncbi:MAG: D-alanyl-D-alanine carboxypeptidase family protein [Lachnospira sp.]
MLNINVTYRHMRKLLMCSALVAVIFTTIISSVFSATKANASPSMSGDGATYLAADLSDNTSNLDDTWPTAPEVSAESVILIDADTGSILYEKDAYSRMYPASTTKILTGLLTIENSSMDEVITFSSRAANSINPYEDANLGTKTGEQYTVEQALYGLLLYSANEIAYGLAEHVSGSLTAFVQMMNDRATQCGAKDTHFANASGLFDENHYTTAYDMAMIARECYNNATFVGIDSTATTYCIPATNKTSQPRYFKHRLQMLEGREFYYEYCKGGKTGFTDESLYTLVTFAEKDGIRLICVVFREPDEDVRFVDSKNLFEWGFNTFQKSTTGSGQISSLFSTSNYYNSDVFSTKKLNFDLSASFITIPKSASPSDVVMNINKDYNSTNENGVLSAELNYLYGSHVVGASKLNISSVSNSTSSQLPLIEKDSGTTSLKPKKVIRVNLWIVVIILVSVIVFTFLVVDVRLDRKRRRRRRRRR